MESVRSSLLQGLQQPYWITWSWLFPTTCGIIMARLFVWLIDWFGFRAFNNMCRWTFAKMCENDTSKDIIFCFETLCLLYYRLCGDIDSECGFDVVSHPNLLYTNVLQRQTSCSWSLQLELGSRTPILHLITHRPEILKQVQYQFAA